MPRRIISCVVQQERFMIRFGGNIAGTAGSFNDVVLRISFDDLWEDYTKKIVFFDAMQENSVLVELTTNMLVDDLTDTYDVPIPAEAKAVEGDMVFTIKGVIVSGALETQATLTTGGVLRVLPARWDPYAEEAADVTPQVADQLQAQIDVIKQDIVDAARAADAKEAAAQSAAEAEGSAATALSYANSAFAAATDAGSSANAAALSKNAAEGAANRAEAAVVHQPMIGGNGNWWVWNFATGEYQDTGYQAEGPEGPQGPAGRPGRDGNSFVIEDVYATLSQLRYDYPHGNKYAYQVTDEDDEVFIWSEMQLDWVSVGKIVGPKGDTGPYFTPAVSAAGVISWTNNGGLPNPDAVNIKGADGAAGPYFTPAVSSAGVISWTNNGGLPNPPSVDLASAAGPKRSTVTLTPAGWTGTGPFTQTVTVYGVLSDETAQLIQPVPANASSDSYYEAGIVAVAQAANSLTFRSMQVPAVSLVVYICVSKLEAYTV